jgi:hypothetical protein
LVDGGAKTDVADEKGNIPLFYAEEKGITPIADFLKLKLKM